MGREILIFCSFNYESSNLFLFFKIFPHSHTEILEQAISCQSQPRETLRGTDDAT